MQTSIQSMLYPDEIPLRRGKAMKDPHLPLEEPVPYVYDHYPTPVRKEAGIDRPVGLESMLHNGIQCLQFQEDALRVTPYDLDTRDENSHSRRTTVNTFLHPPIRPMWMDQSYTRIPSKIVHPEIPVHQESSTRGFQNLQPDRDPSRVLVHDQHYDTKVKDYHTDSHAGKRMDKVNYVNPVQRGNLHDGAPEESVQRQVHQQSIIQKQMGSHRFWMQEEPKLEDTFTVDPARDPHLQLYGRTPSENVELTQKMDRIYNPIRKEYRFQLFGRAPEENQVLTRKADIQEQHQYSQPLTKVRICPNKPQLAKLSRYTPHLTPDHQVEKRIPSHNDQNFGTVVPNYHRRMTVDNEGDDGLDTTGAAIPQWSPNVEPQIQGLRRGVY